ncbi:hypothetical protein [Streptacidiphilus sp. PAMC 29251]
MAPPPPDAAERDPAEPSELETVPVHRAVLQVALGLAGTIAARGEAEPESVRESARALTAVLGRILEPSWAEPTEPTEPGRLASAAASTVSGSGRLSVGQTFVSS